MAETPAPTTPAVPPPTPVHPSSSGDLTRRLIVAAIVFAAIGLAVLLWRDVFGDPAQVSTDDAYLRADVTPLSAKVEGYVVSVPVTDNQHVAAGQLLVEIRSDDYAAQVDQAAANVAASEAAIVNIEREKELQKTLIRQAEATILAAEADYTRYHLEAERQRILIKSGIVGTKQLVEQATDNEAHAQATVTLNEAQRDQQSRQLEVYDSSEAQAEASLKAQQAALKLARINLGYTKITAPADGTIGERTVKPGQFVRNGTQVMTLVPAAAIWVVANFKETQLTRVRPGDPAQIVVDTFPDTALTGRVDSLSPASGAQFALLPPDNSTGNFTKIAQRIPVKIILDAAPRLAGLLRPGMSVTASIRPAR